MFAIRTWLLVVTLAAALFGTIVLAAPAVEQQRLAQETRRRVEGAAQAAELLLRLHTPKWVDAATQFATDAVIGDALDEANRDSHELPMLSKSLQTRLRSVRDKSHADLALVFDAKGRMVAESGGSDLKPRAAFADWEAVAAGLRGSRVDAYWILGGRAFHVAIAPASRERGVVALGQELGPELLATLRDTIGTDLVLATPERVVAAAPAQAQVAQIPARIFAQRTPRKEDPRDTAFFAERIGVGKDSMLFAGRWLGDRTQGLVLCALASQPNFEAPLGRVEAIFWQLRHSMASRDVMLRVGLILLAALLLLVAFGQWLVGFDGQRPLRRLLGEVQLVARGDQQRLSIERIPKRFAVLVRTLNAAFDRFGHRARLAATPPPAEPAFRLSEAPGVSTVREMTPPPIAPMLSPASEEGDRVWAVAPKVGNLFAPTINPPSMPANSPANSPAPPVTLAVRESPEDAEMRTVFQAFVETRETCGESTQGLTWEKFAARLRQTSATVQQQQNCSAVRYGVYVKDGKAAIKVTPVK